MSKKRVISLSVHGLVDFLLREGDIDNRVYNENTMEIGTKIHAAFQKKQGHEYLSEVPLAESFERPQAIIQLEGRADGIINGDPIIIDEIKSTVEKLTVFYQEQRAWHLGQAECYALMYLHAHGLAKAIVRLTYISQIDNSEMVKEKLFSLLELETDVYSLMDRYLALSQTEYSHIDARNNSVKTLVFPYRHFRMGQREMAKYVYAIASKGGTFFCEAPTGIGKTISAIYPAIKAFARGDNSKIFYLTAKSSGSMSAYDALTRLYEKGLCARDSLLIAKEKICFSPGKNCNPDECPFAKGYYSKLRAVSDEVLHSDQKRLNPKAILSLATEKQMCPFELQLDLSLWSDVIICDYNYFFDPLVKLERYFDPTVDSSHYIVLVDEAHNLVERGRDMYSAVLSLSACAQARKSLSHAKAPKVKTALKKITESLEELNDVQGKEACADYPELPDEIEKGLDLLTKQTRSLDKEKHPSYPQTFKDFSREAYRFSFLNTNYSSETRLYGKRCDGDYELHLFCLDPAPLLADSFSKVKGSAVFSATLSPIHYYMQAITGSSKAAYLLLPSPFPSENFDLIIVPTVSTRFRDRAKTYQEIARYLSTFVSMKNGNYFLYFPSYSYLENILPFLSFPNARVLVQKKDMGQQARQDFLDNFVLHPVQTTVGLLVIGGAFSEGIDLCDDRLIGVAVVGIGLPQPSYEQGLIQAYFEKVNGQGFEYAYVNPGMNKVMQAVGRLIRSETDKGAALLIDDRYMQNNYRDLFARSWKGYHVATCVEDVKENLQLFYKDSTK